jgi:hypothetical protein
VLLAKAPVFAVDVHVKIYDVIHSLSPETVQTAQLAFGRHAPTLNAWDRPPPGLESAAEALPQ